jgi:hypothetical protein
MAEDPVRLLEDEGSELMHSLLSAVREEQPKHAAMQRTLTALGVGTALTSIASGSSALSASSAAGGFSGAVSLGSAKGAAGPALMVIKWLSAGLLTGLVATSAVYVVTQPTAVNSPAGSATSVLAKQVALQRSHPPRVLASASSAAKAPEIPEQVELPAASPEVRSIPAPAADAAGPSELPLSARVPPSSSADHDAQLAAELSLLDRARQALAAGNAASALRSLNDYDARFEHPNLLPEALYLRLEAFTLKGDRSETENVARRMLQAFPAGPHAARARAVLGVDK